MDETDNMIQKHRIVTAQSSRQAYSRRVWIMQQGGNNIEETEYVAMMNAVFAAQRDSVPIDAAVIGDKVKGDTALEQAAHLTGGIFQTFNSNTVLAKLLVNTDSKDTGF
jgi:hypothetical protein